MSEQVKNQAESFLPEQKKAYQPPELISYGTVAELTNNNAAGTGLDNAQALSKS